MWYGGLGSSEYYHKRSLRVKSKIVLNIENKTVIVLNKIILPIELDIYVWSYVIH